MTKSNSRVFAVIAAICYTVFVTYSIFSIVIRAINHAYSIETLQIIYWLVLIGLAVTLFMKNKIAVICAAGAAVLLNTYYLLRWFSFVNFCDFVAYSMLLVLVILALTGKRVVSYLWFIPGAIMLIGTVVSWFQYDYFSFLSQTWSYILHSLLEVAALVFAGLWLAGDVAPAKAAPAIPYTQYNPNAYAPQNPYAQPQQNPYAQPQQNQYAQPQQNQYAQPQQNPYAQPQQNPYAQPQQNPYAQPQPEAATRSGAAPQSGFVDIDWQKYAPLEAGITYNPTKNYRFHRAEGFVGSIPQQFVNSTFPKCPICRSNNPYWTIGQHNQMSWKGNLYMFKCSACDGIISMSIPDVTTLGKGGVGFAANASVGLTNIIAKSSSGKEAGAVYAVIESVGRSGVTPTIQGKEFKLDQVKEMMDR